jgi:hypothetical protein
MDIKDLRILLSSIIELRELYGELVNPARGANGTMADIIHETGMERLERVESGEYYSEWDHRRITENPSGSS